MQGRKGRAITYIALLLAAILTIAAFLSACAEAETPPAGDDLPPAADSGEDDSGEEEDGESPDYYTRFEENGKEYVYFGHAAGEAADADLNNALTNLKESGTVTADADGFYNYNDKKYVCVVADEAAAGRRLHDGSTIEAGKEYFFEYSPVKWRILAINDGVAQLLSEQVLGAAVFNPAGSFNSTTGLTTNGEKANDFNASYLKTYLNGSFKDTLFTESESSYLAGGADAVGLLTLEQIDAYDLKEEEGYMMAVSPTEYLVAEGVEVSKIGNDYYSAWWLATPGKASTAASLVSAGGQYGEYYEDTVSAVHGLRPAIALRL